MVDDIRERYPQVEIYLKKNKMKNFAALLKKTQSDTQKQSTELDIESFQSVLSEVDSQMKNLPATAQVNTYILIILACKSLFFNYYIYKSFFWVCILVGCCPTR